MNIDPISISRKIADLERVNKELTNQRDDYFNRLLGAAQAGLFKSTTQLELTVFNDRAKDLRQFAVDFIGWFEAPTGDQSHTLLKLKEKAWNVLKGV